jgi:hypothetical protein
VEEVHALDGPGGRKRLLSSYRASVRQPHFLSFYVVTRTVEVWHAFICSFW